MGNNCAKGEKALEEAPAGFVKPRTISDSDQDRASMMQENNVSWENLMKTTRETNLVNLRDDFSKNPKLFLVNNIAMSVQFYKNFDRDKDEIKTSKIAEKDYFDKCLSPMKKNTIIPPTVLSKVHEYVSYKNEVGDYEPLVTDQFIICYNNVEVDRSENFDQLQNGSVEYAHLDTDNPTYRVCIEDRETKHPGFVRVRCVDDYSKLEQRSSERTHTPDCHQPEREKVQHYLDNLQPSSNLDTLQPSTNLDTLQPSSKLDTMQPSPLPSPSLKKLAFEDVMEEDEDEEEEDDQQGDSGVNKDVLDLRKLIGANVGKDNYLIKPEFGPSKRQNRVENSVAEQLNLPAKLQERRPSGVVPASYSKLMSDNQNFKNKMKEKNGIQKSRQQPRSSGDQNPSSRAKPPQTSTLPETGEDENYGYVSLKKMPLNLLDNRPSRAGSLIPADCFEEKDVTIVENSDTDPYPIDADKETRHYLSSKGMINYFKSQFPLIVDQLDKDAFKDPDNLRYLQPDIYCQEFEDRKMNIYKFSPSIECGFWPDQGYEWQLRQRCIMRDKRTGVEYQWPSKEQIDAAQQLGFNIVPRGFVFPRKNTVNPDADIEWEVMFSKAELFISRNLHHPKLRVYLFSLVLYKSYFEVFDGLNEEHFRFILYWLVERSPGDWTEENVGEKLLVVLHYLKKHLIKQKMPNYFLSKRNMFANIGNNKLRAAQEKCYRILEKPVLHILNSLGSLHYEKNYYPKFDVKRLYKILTDEAQNQLAQTLGGGFEEDTSSTTYQTLPREIKPAGDRYQEKMRQERRRLEELKKGEKEYKKVQKPVVSLEAEIKPFDTIRKKLLLEFFIEHFIKMAEKSNIFRSHGQGFMYVQHSENLLTLLSELGYDNTPKYNQLKENIYRLKQNHTVMYMKDYWNISYSHPKLFQSSSFRSTEERETIPLPSLPSEEASPIPGTERNENTSLPATTTDDSKVSVSADVHAKETNESPVNPSTNQIPQSSTNWNATPVNELLTPTQDQHDAKNKLGKYQTMLEELDEDEEEEVGENEVAEEVLGKEDRNWERIDLGYSPEESDDFFSIRL